MKKFYFAVLAVVCVLFAACENGQTPQTDKSKLYPAFNTSAEAWGYIDDGGNFVIQPMFDDVSGFSCGYAKVWMGDDLKFIDKKGSMQTTPSIDDAFDFYYGYSTIKLDDNWGLMGKNFDMAIQPYFYGLGTMSDNGLVVAMRTDDSKCEYVNAKGETKIPAMYDECYAFKDGVAIIKLNKKYGAINKSGDFVIQPTYEYGLWNMGEGLVGFYDKNEKAGILDKNGNTIIPAMYYDLGNVSDGMIWFEGKNKCGYLDAKGNVVIPEMYYTVRDFHEGLAWVKQSEDSKYYQCIDKNNQVVFRLGEDEYPETGFHNGLALVITENGYKYIDTKGFLVYAWSYDKDEWYAPKKVQKCTMKGGVRVVEQDDMTLHFDSRKL